MKRFSTLFCFLFLASTYGQIDPGCGIIGLDACDLEDRCTLISIDSTVLYDWQIGIPNKPFFDSAMSKPMAILTDTVKPYSPNTLSRFELKIPNLAFINMIFGFSHKYQTDTLTDGGYIEISHDNGVTWKNVMLYDSVYHPIHFFTENMYSSTDSLIDGNIGFSGKSNNWVHSRIQWIWAFPIKTIPDTIRLRFNFISDSIQTNKAGWMIDDIHISWAWFNSINEHFNDDQVKIFPNPSEGILNFDIDEVVPLPMALTIYDLMGNKCYEQQIFSRSEQISFNPTINGIYGYKLSRDLQTLMVGKIMVK